MSPDSFGPIFTHCILNRPLHFYIFCKFSLLQGLDPNLSFLVAAVSLWEWKDGSSQEKVSLFYSLHTLYYFDIDLWFIYYIYPSFSAQICKVFQKCMLTRFFNMAASFIQVFSYPECIQMTITRQPKIVFIFYENTVFGHL